MLAHNTLLVLDQRITFVIQHGDCVSREWDNGENEYGTQDKVSFVGRIHLWAL